jgi:hypothetical protein
VGLNYYNYNNITILIYCNDNIILVKITGLKWQ